jgi:hypothetical protein
MVVARMLLVVIFALTGVHTFQCDPKGCADFQKCMSVYTSETESVEIGGLDVSTTGDLGDLPVVKKQLQTASWHVITMLSFALLLMLMAIGCFLKELQSPYAGGVVLVLLSVLCGVSATILYVNHPTELYTMEQDCVDGTWKVGLTFKADKKLRNSTVEFLLHGNSLCTMCAKPTRTHRQSQSQVAEAKWMLQQSTETYWVGNYPKRNTYGPLVLFTKNKTKELNLEDLDLGILLIRGFGFCFHLYSCWQLCLIGNRMYVLGMFWSEPTERSKRQMQVDATVNWIQYVFKAALSRENLQDVLDNMYRCNVFVSSSSRVLTQNDIDQRDFVNKNYHIFRSQLYRVYLRAVASHIFVLILVSAIVTKKNTTYLMTLGGYA